MSVRKKPAQPLTYGAHHFSGDCGFWETPPAFESAIVRRDQGSLGAVVTALKTLLGTNGSGKKRRRE